MNPLRCKVILRPRGPLEVFDLALRFGRERAGAFLRLAAALLLPLWLVASLASWWFAGHWAVVLPVLVVGGALRAPFTVLAGRLLFEEGVTARSTLFEALRQGPRLVGAWSVHLLGWVLAALTCFVALPWVQGALLYLEHTALLERVPLARGVRRSLRLVSGRPSHAVAGTLASWGLVLWFALVGEAVGQAMVSFVLQLGEPFGSLGQGQVTPWLLGGLLLAQPVIAVYRLLLYVDVRTRVEGWDLQVGLRAAGLAR